MDLFRFSDDPVFDALGLPAPPRGAAHEAGDHPNRPAAHVPCGSTGTPQSSSGPADLGALLAPPGLAGRGRPPRTASGTGWTGWTTRPSVPWPEKILCVGLNYRSHILEMGRELPEYPTLFAKFARALVGAHDPVIAARRVDARWTGRPSSAWSSARQVRGMRPPKQAADGHRRVHRGQRRHRARLPVPDGAVAPGQDLRALARRWARGWSPPTRPRSRASSAAPWTGRWCRRPTPPTWSSTRRRWWRTSRTIITLVPGDLIATGTPGGVGHARKPPRYLCRRQHPRDPHRGRRRVPQQLSGGRSVRIAVVGGGPGGLFFAALVRQADPAIEVTVFERNRADETFGFGVVFSDRTLAGIHDGRPRPARRAGRARAALGQTSRCGSRASGSAAAATGCPRSSGARCSRCCRSGPWRRAPSCGSPPRSAWTTWTGYDLVVAADGTGSTIRDAAGTPRSVRPLETATAKFIWFGTDYRFDGLTFVHERGPHGVFAVHGYPISADARARSSSRPTRRRGARPGSTSSTSPSHPGRAT